MSINIVARLVVCSSELRYILRRKKWGVIGRQRFLLDHLNRGFYLKNLFPSIHSAFLRLLYSVDRIFGVNIYIVMLENPNLVIMGGGSLLRLLLRWNFFDICQTEWLFLRLINRFFNFAPCNLFLADRCAINRRFERLFLRLLLDRRKMLQVFI